MTDAIDFQELVRTIGDRLKWLREKHSMCLQELAEQLEVSWEEIQEYETGEISAARLYQYAELFGESIDWFFPEDDRVSIVRKTEINDAVRYQKLDLLSRRDEKWLVYGEESDDRFRCLGVFLTEAAAHEYVEQVEAAKQDLVAKTRG